MVARLDIWATVKVAPTYLFFCNWDDLKILIKFFNLISTLGQSLAVAQFLVARLGYLGNREGCPYIFIFCNWDDLKILIKFFNFNFYVGDNPLRLPNFWLPDWIFGQP